MGFTAKCGALINCTFSTKEAIWKDAGGPPVSFAAKVSVARAGGLCPATAEWDLAYEAVEPSRFEIGPSGPPDTLLCANGSPEEAVCGEGAGKTRYEGPVEAASSSWTLAFTPFNLSCQSQLTLDPATGASEASIAADVTALSLSSCKTPSGVECTVTAVNLPYPAAIESSEGESTLAIEDPVGAGIQVICGAIVNCTFTTKATTWSDTGGPPVSFIALKVVLERTGGICPVTAELNATYKVTEPAGFAIL